MNSKAISMKDCFASNIARNSATVLLDLSNRIITCVWLRFKGSPNVAETYLHKRHLGNHNLLFRFPFIVYCQDPVLLVSIYMVLAASAACLAEPPMSP